MKSVEEIVVIEDLKEFKYEVDKLFASMPDDQEVMGHLADQLTTGEPREEYVVDLLVGRLWEKFHS